MTTYYNREVDIGQQDGGTFFWRLAPIEVKWVMEAYGPEIAVTDSRGASYSGDDFWDMAGFFDWDSSRVGQAVTS